MVTVGMNYKVHQGREEEFESVFHGVVNSLRELPGHVDTRLYRDCEETSDYLILSEWTSREAFEEFIGSGSFARVTAWGRSGILRDRPSHEVYEHSGAGDAPTVNDTDPDSAACPVSHSS